MNTRKKIWNDRQFAEQWEYAGLHVMRFRTLSSYPWKYLIGEFTKNHMVYAEAKHRDMTPEEIQKFKSTKVVHI